jgi:LysR family transcriptional regulator, regulator for genes of the gallate degradation pathway
MIPNLRHLSILCLVARLGSVTAAARAAHLTQPAVTQAIAALERNFGTRLFTRTPHGMTATEAGRTCAARVDRALARIAEALDEDKDDIRGNHLPPPTRARSPAHAITAGQLEALLLVVDAGGFGRAARTAGMTRATLHRAAKRLERTIGVPLFEATSHGIRPTREAVRLAMQVHLGVGELRQARAEITALAGAERGETAIGAMPLARSRLIPEAVLRFCARHPQHRISILDGPYEGMLELLRQGRADLLIGAMREATPPDVIQEPLFEDPLALIVRAGHPLANHSGGYRRAPAAEALMRFPWIAPRRESPLRRHFDRLFRGAAPSPGAPIECNSLVAARELLLASDRIMLLSEQQAHHELAAGELVALPHPEGCVVRQIGLTLRRDWHPTAAQSELLDMIRDASHSRDR